MLTRWRRTRGENGPKQELDAPLLVHDVSSSPKAAGCAITHEELTTCLTSTCSLLAACV